MMTITYEDIAQVNKDIKRVDIKGKKYALVSSRVQAFRKLYPEGRIETEKEELDPIITYDNEGRVIRQQRVVSYKAYIYANKEDEYPHYLADGDAEEIEGSSMINSSSFKENCQTSAVGRALAFAGIGSDEDIASAEEMVSAQGYEKISKEQAKNLKDFIKEMGGSESYILSYHKVKAVEDMTTRQYADVIKYLERGGGKR